MPLQSAGCVGASRRDPSQAQGELGTRWPVAGRTKEGDKGPWKGPAVSCPQGDAELPSESFGPSFLFGETGNWPVLFPALQILSRAGERQA